MRGRSGRKGPGAHCAHRGGHDHRPLDGDGGHSPVGHGLRGDAAGRRAWLRVRGRTIRFFRTAPGGSITAFSVPVRSVPPGGRLWRSVAPCGVRSSWALTTTDAAPRQTGHPFQKERRLGHDRTYGCVGVPRLGRPGGLHGDGANRRKLWTERYRGELSTPATATMVARTAMGRAGDDRSRAGQQDLLGGVGLALASLSAEDGGARATRCGSAPSALGTERDERKETSGMVVGRNRWSWLWNTPSYARRVAMLGAVLSTRYPKWSWDGRWPIVWPVPLLNPDGRHALRWMSVPNDGGCLWDPGPPARWIHLLVKPPVTATVDMMTTQPGWRCLWHVTRRAGIATAWRLLRLLLNATDLPRLAGSVDRLPGAPPGPGHGPVRGTTRGYADRPGPERIPTAL